MFGDTLCDDAVMDGGKYPTYSHLYVSYFHPDWRWDDFLPDDVVRQFMELSHIPRRMLFASS